MTDDDLARLLAEAFDARARGALDDHAAPPLPRFADPSRATSASRLELSPSSARSPRTRWWAPLAAAAAVLAVAAGVTAVVVSDDGSQQVAAGPSGDRTSGGPIAAANAVRITTLNADGDTYGVGMPVIAYFSKRITDARAFQAATKATANGKPLAVAWYFQRSKAGRGPIEGHLRPQQYWPAHSQIHVQFPAAGTPLGDGLRSDGKLASLDFRIGARTILTVDDQRHRLSVTSDGRSIDTFKVSLGSESTPTTRGIKVIMEKGRAVPMRGPGYYEPAVRFTQRLTYSGEYLHAAPWNVKNIDRGVDSSNGCTNMLPGDAGKLYRQTRVGDVVQYPNADGPTLQVGQGYGDWNVSWTQWRTGGLVPTG